MSDYESHQDDDERVEGVAGDDEPAPDAEDEQEKVESGSSESGNTPADQFTEKPDDATIEEIEHEREERLDPDNRPENVEVDNTQREFDSEKGMFTDSEGYDEAPNKFPPPGEQGV